MICYATDGLLMWVVVPRIKGTDVDPDTFGRAKMMIRLNVYL